MHFFFFLSLLFMIKHKTLNIISDKKQHKLGSIFNKNGQALQHYQSLLDDLIWSSDLCIKHRSAA